MSKPVNAVPRGSLVALPTLSGGLCNLPYANSIANLAIHPSTMAKNARDSEEKLKRSLQTTAASRNCASSTYSIPHCPPSPANGDSPLMMRTLRHRS